MFPGLGLFAMQGGHGIDAVGVEGGDVACVKPFSLLLLSATGNFYRDKKGDISEFF